MSKPLFYGMFSGRCAAAHLGSKRNRDAFQRRRVGRHELAGLVWQVHVQHRVVQQRQSVRVVQPAAGALRCRLKAHLRRAASGRRMLAQRNKGGSRNMQC